METVPAADGGLTFEKVRAGIQSLKESRKETDRLMQETYKQMQETDRKMQATDKRLFRIPRASLR